ncbi:hypothetical protein SLE2022_082810 [Rubroshorea leprosula]
MLQMVGMYAWTSTDSIRALRVGVAHCNGVPKIIKVDILAFILVVLWSIWYARNAIHHVSGSCWDVDAIFNFILRKSVAWIQGKTDASVLSLVSGV